MTITFVKNLRKRRVNLINLNSIPDKLNLEDIEDSIDEFISLYELCDYNNTKFRQTLLESNKDLTDMQYKMIIDSVNLALSDC